MNLTVRSEVTAIKTKNTISDLIFRNVEKKNV